MKILVIDIETKPHTGYVWQLFNQNISLSQLKETGGTICFAAKWLGEDEVLFRSDWQGTHRSMVKAAHKLMNEADAIVHYNGTKFDIPMLHKEFIKLGLPPPAPHKNIDLYREVRRNFKFASNKLDHVSEQLGLGKKTAHTGFKLWLDVLDRLPEALELMEEYNIQDVLLTEKVYHKVLPWIKNHPNMSLYKDGHVCPNCGGTHLQARGFYLATAGKYQRYQCKDCGKWSSSTTVTQRFKEKNKLKSI